ncbi:MAG: dihydrodipicolinate synthase family protein [Anaerolineae bacterium]|nr:dihydrodipicolinate synthase family protein [Anaerolineae bacterium]
MSEQKMRGVFPILVTPFDEASRVDVDSLQQLVAFELAAGVHGLGIALGSEVFKLSEAERALVTRTVVDAVGGRVPVVVNSGAAGTDLALLYSRMAEEGGADALMVMPSSVMPATSDGVRAYYRALSAATALPIYIQDTSSAHVPAGLARQIAQECAQVRYIKVESSPTALMVEEAVREAGDLLTVFGGAGGTYLLEELARGSVGTMPGCSHPEAFVAVWDLYQRGEQDAARRVFYDRILPINRISGLGWGAFYHVHKEILRQRGAIRTATVREPATPLDEATRRDLQRVIDALYPAAG